MRKLGEGTFGEVHQARHVQSGTVVALKRIIINVEKEGFPLTSLREIKLLKMLYHDNVLKLNEMAVERPEGVGRKRANLYMVTPYMDHDLSGLLNNPDVHFSEGQIKCYMLQFLRGLRYLHGENIIHRDLKAANILINNRGRLIIADFGLARHYEGVPPQRGRGNGVAKRDYTGLVVTRWYRPPELLFNLKKYTPAVDMWGAGCVFGEMFKRKPILQGTSEINQVEKIFDLVGSCNDANMPGWDKLPGCEGIKKWQYRPGNLSQVFREEGPGVISLLSELLKLDWHKRINAIDAIEHPYFKQEPLPMREEDIPTFADSHELDNRNNSKRAPPPPAGGTVGMGPNGDMTGSGPPPHWRGRDRGPPGVPPPANGAPAYGQRGYDRRPPPGYDHRPPPRNMPPWGSGADHNRGGQGLPYDGPRHSTLPPPPGEGRHPLPPAPHPYRGGPGQDRSHRDTYIPNYNGGARGPDNRRSKDPEDRREGRGGSHGPVGYRDRDGGPKDFGRDRRDPRSRSRSPDRRERNIRNRDDYRR